ncbi:serine/threonine-protein kinase [Chroococcidiopsis sp. TS-821]|uniref:serine/threonine-protein kinase n=1 Tax=Chroococcidiopsis sp. TS-821 TaxID=1378066 RepID=UPI000CEEE15F|nr:serine/threonine-protein kinase [Chroococcidiopsis sp. TS-821]PPS40249.1 serine/threonine protein kinase [Chroococcidiopsis sp. TS-821]
MSYCLNPNCSNPQNSSSRQTCAACGAPLLLRDRYRALQALAQGGFGATFLAQDVTLPGEPKCVIKQLRPSATSSEALDMARKLFAREAKTLGKIGSHPQVPRLLDYFEDSEQFYLVQEYINGLTLQQEVKRSGPFSETGVKQFLSEILPTLQYLHSQQVIHRDIKPANIIRRHEDCKLVLIDFGAVKDQVSQTTSMSENTALTAFAVGTPGFAPPEQLAMRPVYASDIYALGVTCIYLLTGKSPKDLDYNSSTGEMVWQNKVQISDRFRKVLQKMVEGSVRHRYQSPNEVLTALELEPYMDSLANSMAAQPSAVRKPKLPRKVKQATPTTTPVATTTSAYTGSSAAQSRAQLAAAIRARRANLTEASNTSIQSPLPSVALTSAPSTVGAKPKSPPRKLDANNLVLSYIKGRRDFASYDLSLLDLQRVDLSEVNFRAAKLDRTNFFKCILSGNDFSHASLKRTNFREAILTKAYFHSADLEGADFRGANLSYADFSEAHLKNVNLCGANLTGAKVSDEQLAQAKVNWMTVRPNGKRGWF